MFDLPKCRSYLRNTNVFCYVRNFLVSTTPFSQSQRHCLVFDLIFAICMQVSGIFSFFYCISSSAVELIFIWSSKSPSKFNCSYWRYLFVAWFVRYDNELFIISRLDFNRTLAYQQFMNQWTKFHHRKHFVYIPLRFAMILDTFRYTTIGSAIKCFECNSHYNQGCELDNVPSNFSVDCSLKQDRDDRNKPIQYTLCRKVLQVIEFSVNQCK